MRLYISPKGASKAGIDHLSRFITSFRVEPFVKLHRDGSASHCYRVALINSLGFFAGWA
jgi:hypothetical protein